MDTSEEIATQVLERLSGDPRRVTPFTRWLRISIEIAIEASLLTDEGRGVTFSLLLDVDEEAQSSKGVDWGTDLSWKPGIQCEPKELTARDLAANSRLSKAGETFFHVSGGGSTPDSRPTICVSAITRPPRTFKREIFADRRHLGLTVLGPFHLVIESGGRELLYVRSGRVSRHVSSPWPKKVEDILCHQELDAERATSIPDYVRRYSFDMIGRAMWLSATGGMIAILAEAEADVPKKSDWNLRGERLDIPGMHFDEYANGQRKGQCEYDEDAERALEYQRSLEDSELLARNGVADLARFTQLDGAVILCSDLTLAGFGRKLEPDYEAPLKYIKTDEITGVRGEVKSLGGTRHKSAAHWVAEGKGRLALVASQDRKLGWVFNAELEERAVEYWPWRPRLF